MRDAAANCTLGLLRLVEILGTCIRWALAVAFAAFMLGLTGLLAFWVFVGPFLGEWGVLIGAAIASALALGLWAFLVTITPRV